MEVVMSKHRTKIIPLFFMVHISFLKLK